MMFYSRSAKSSDTSPLAGKRASAFAYKRLRWRAPRSLITLVIDNRLNRLTVQGLKGMVGDTAIRVGFIFISCKQDEKEFVLPVFSVFVGTDDQGGDRRKYVDTRCRTYKDWDNWKTDNQLPMLKYAYPTRGFFTCSGNNTYKFDENRNPDVEHATSPQCDLSSRICGVADGVSAFALFGL